MRVLIVDDEAPARDKLRRMLGEHADVQVAGEAADGLQGLELAAQLAPDAMFVDVQMPEAGGLDLAASLPDGGPALVFVTAFDRYALQAFEARALDYLLKPVDPERLARALQRLRVHAAGLRAQGAAPRRLLIPDRGRTHVVDCGQVAWLAAAGNYVTVHAAGRGLLMRRTLAGLLDDLGDGFARIHRSSAVALAHVASVRVADKGDAVVVLCDGTALPCSRQFRAVLMQRLADRRP